VSGDVIGDMDGHSYGGNDIVNGIGQFGANMYSAIRRGEMRDYARGGDGVLTGSIPTSLEPGDSAGIFGDAFLMTDHSGCGDDSFQSPSGGGTVRGDAGTRSGSERGGDNKLTSSDKGVHPADRRCRQHARLCARGR
jgi:hypothetical protein